MRKIPKANYTWKQICPEDIDLFHGLVKQVAQEAQMTPFTRDMLQAYLEQENNWVFGIFEDNKLIGSAALEFIVRSPTLSYLEFTGAQRLKEYKGKRVGDALFAARFEALSTPSIANTIKKTVFQLGGRSIHLSQCVAHVGLQNDVARGALMRNGFQVSDMIVELDGEAHRVCFVDICNRPKLEVRLELP